MAAAPFQDFWFFHFNILHPSSLESTYTVQPVMSPSGLFHLWCISVVYFCGVFLLWGTFRVNLRLSVPSLEQDFQIESQWCQVNGIKSAFPCLLNSSFFSLSFAPSPVLESVLQGAWDADASASFWNLPRWLWWVLPPLPTPPQWRHVRQQHTTHSLHTLMYWDGWFTKDET